MRIFAKPKHRGVEQLVARRAHNPEAGGSSPSPATKAGKSKDFPVFSFSMDLQYVQCKIRETTVVGKSTNTAELPASPHSRESWQPSRIYDLEQDYAKDRFHFARADEISLGKADLFCPAADMEGISKTDQRIDSH